MTLWLENVREGQQYRTAGRQLTESDLVTFSMLSGDWNPLHTDPAHARSLGYEDRVLHGVLGIAILTGQMDRAGWFDISAVAMLGIEDWRFLAPLRIGAVVHTEMTIGVVRPSTSRTGTGVVDRHFRLVDHKGGALQTGRIPMMIAARPAEPNPTG